MNFIDEIDEMDEMDEIGEMGPGWPAPPLDSEGPKSQNPMFWYFHRF